MSIFAKHAIIVTDMDFYGIPQEQLGGLIVAFQKRFGTYSLVPMFYTANDSRGKYKLMVAKSLDHNGKQWEEPKHLEEHCDQTERTNMLAFLHGYRAALEANRNEKDQER